MPKAKAPETPALPKSHLTALREMGFTVMEYLPQSVEVEGGDREWLPRLCVGTDPNGKFRIVEYLPKGHPSNAYGFDGWQPITEFSGGGMCREIGQALGWFKWLEEQKGKR